MSDNDDLTTYRFHVTDERVEDMEFGLLMDVSGERMSIPAMARFLAHFMVDGDGQYLEPAEAMKAVRYIKVREMKATVEKLTVEMQEAAVPNG